MLAKLGFRTVFLRPGCRSLIVIFVMFSYRKSTYFPCLLVVSYKCAARRIVNFSFLRWKMDHISDGNNKRMVLQILPQ